MQDTGATTSSKTATQTQFFRASRRKTDHGIGECCNAVEMVISPNEILFKTGTQQAKSGYNGTALQTQENSDSLGHPWPKVPNLERR